MRTAEAVDVEAYYFTSLQYGQFLWQRGRSGRAILALTRALYADLPETALVLQNSPLPYAAIHWIVLHHPSDDFPGNPRVSFQHQATRMEGRQKELRRARAWAVWYLVRHAKPSLSADPRQVIEEPDSAAIEAGLRQWGHTDEVEVWRAASR
ncbi:MAG: hypothetical protein GVY36_03020 [Verrucomicrobia bacterium]|nr:hypothetical protein [Verrucomicrobiota bacterium]